MQFPVAVFVAVVSTTILPVPEEAALLGAGTRRASAGCRGTLPRWRRARRWSWATLPGTGRGDIFWVPWLGRALVDESFRSPSGSQERAWWRVTERWQSSLRAVSSVCGAPSISRLARLAIRGGGFLRSTRSLRRSKSESSLPSVMGRGSFANRVSGGALTLWVDAGVLLAAQARSSSRGSCGPGCRVARRGDGCRSLRPHRLAIQRRA